MSGCIGDTWQLQLSDCARRLSGLPLGVATRPVPKLLWALLFHYMYTVAIFQFILNAISVVEYVV